MLLLFLKSPDLKRKPKVIQSMIEVEWEYLGMRFYCTSVGYLNMYYLKENISKYDTLGSEFIKTSDDNSTSKFLGAPSPVCGFLHLGSRLYTQLQWLFNSNCLLLLTVSQLRNQFKLFTAI